MKHVADIVRAAQSNYLDGNTTLGKYVNWSMHDTLETIDSYLNSKHIKGDTDSLGREKPFFNIVTSAVNIWYRATDIDRKDIRILPDRSETLGLAYIANIHLQDWMKRARFGVFLNDWGRALARYGSAVVKFVEADGDLTASVVPWNRFVADPVDFDAIPRIEKFYMTPAQLRKMPLYDQDAVDSLIEAVTTRKTLDGQQKDNENDFIELYEVHGEMDTRLLEDDPNLNIEDKDIKYRQQMHVVSFIEQGKDGYKDFCLYKGKERRDPYMLTHLIKEDGRTLAIGAVEYLFDAQWMQNHTIKNMKDTLDISSKLIFQTADSRYVGRNVLSAIQTGDIFIHKENMPLTRIANDKPDISALQNFGTMWQSLSRELTSTPDAMRGNTLPSGTPYALGQLLAQQGNSLFEIMTENKGLSIEDMLRDHVIPYLKTKMDTTDEIVATLDGHGITEIDSLYVPAEASRRFNQDAVEKTIKYLQTDNPADAPTPYQPDAAEGQVRQELSVLGSKRFFKPDQIPTKTWADVLKDFEWRVTVEVTNENADKQAVMQTLTTALQTIATNPMILQDPNAKLLFSQILTETGKISPLQLSTMPTVGPPTALPVNQ